MVLRAVIDPNSFSEPYRRTQVPIPAGESGGTVAAPVLWEQLRKIVEGVMSDPDSRQARLERLRDFGNDKTGDFFYKKIPWSCIYR